MNEDEKQIASAMSGILSQVMNGRIKLGKGIVGRVTTITLAVIGGLSLLALRTGSDVMLWVILGLLVVLGGGAVVTIIWFAIKHPAQAMLEGAEFTRHYAVMAAIDSKRPLPELLVGAETLNPMGSSPKDGDGVPHV